jgi:DNA replication and repair protein RecF
VIVSRIQINNFRCFKKKIVDFSAPITLIQGSNGSGKTSILEALYYLCYLRSFRASNTRDLIALGNQELFLKATLHDPHDVDVTHELSIGYAGDKKLVKLDQCTVASYKELMDHYRVVAIFEDDLALIKEGPELRRTFVDHALLLLNPELLVKLRQFKVILDNRNALLKRYQGRQLSDLASYHVWTEQLWQASRELAQLRKELLAKFEHQVNVLLQDYFDEKITISIHYQSKKDVLETDFNEFSHNLGVLLPQELRFGRSLFGAHLDDFSIHYTDKQTRFYVSRGQQKLTIILLKIALLKEITTYRGKTLFLLDDFMTDFDELRAGILINLLSGIDTQLIFTSPAEQSYSDKILCSLGAHQVRLHD